MRGGLVGPDASNAGFRHPDLLCPFSEQFEQVSWLYLMDFLCLPDRRCNFSSCSGPDKFLFIPDAERLTRSTRCNGLSSCVGRSGKSCGLISLEQGHNGELILAEQPMPPSSSSAVTTLDNELSRL